MDTETMTTEMGNLWRDVKVEPKREFKESISPLAFSGDPTFSRSIQSGIYIIIIHLLSDPYIAMS